MRKADRELPPTEDELIKHYKEFNARIKRKLPPLTPDALKKLRLLQYYYWTNLQPKKKIEKVFHTRWRITQFDKRSPIKSIIFTNGNGKPLKITSAWYIWGFMIDLKSKLAREDKDSIGPLRATLDSLEREGVITNLVNCKFSLEYLHSLLAKELTFDNFKQTLRRSRRHLKKRMTVKASK